MVQVSRGSRVAALAGLLLVACGDATAVLDEPEVARMQLVLRGAVAVTVDADGTISGGSLTIVRNTPTSIEAIFRDADNRVVASESDFWFEISPGNARLTYTSSSPKSGTLVGIIAGGTTFEARLRHRSQAHDDFPPTQIPIVIQ